MTRLTIALLFLITACSTNDKTITDFNSQIGTEKAASLDRITNSFEDFLSWHLPDQPNFHWQLCSFIDDLAQNKFDYINEYLLPDSVASVIISDYERTGLNNAMQYYIKKDLDGNTEIECSYKTISIYHQALQNTKNSSFISDYVIKREENRTLTYPRNISIFLDSCLESDFNNPIIKRIAALEFYVLIAYMSLS